MIPKIGKKKLAPVEAGKGQTPVKSYQAVVEKPSENKTKENLLKSNKEITLLAGNNDKSNDNDSTTTTI